MRFASIFLIVCLASCGRQAATDNPLTGGGEAIAENSQTIRRLAGDSIKLVDAAIQEHPEVTQLPAIDSNQRSIVAETDSLDHKADAVKKSEKQVKGIINENAKLKSESDKESRRLWHWLQFAGVIVLIGGAVLAYYMPPLAPAAGIVGAGLLAISTFMLSYSWVVNLLVGILIVFGAGLVGLAMWHKYSKDGKRDADMLTDMLTGKATPREAVAMIRAKRPAVDKAMTQPKPTP